MPNCKADTIPEKQTPACSKVGGSLHTLIGCTGIVKIGAILFSTLGLAAKSKVRNYSNLVDPLSPKALVRRTNTDLHNIHDRRGFSNTEIPKLLCWYFDSSWFVKYFYRREL